MKKFWLPLLGVTFLLLAPTTFAGEFGPSPGWFSGLLGQIVAIFTGDQTGQPGDDPELGSIYVPHGNSLNSGDPELGSMYPPGGNSLNGDDPEIGSIYTPSG